MTTPLQVMQADLPNMPADIIDSWLMTFYNRFGWPPLANNEWRYVLGSGNDISSLRKLTWQRQEISLSPDRLTLQSRDMIIDLARTHVFSQSTVYSFMGDGHERFRRCCDYIKSHKTFPRLVVLKLTSNGYDVLDGHHRLTAFFYLYGYFDVENDETPDPNIPDEQSVWIGT